MKLHLCIYLFSVFKALTVIFVAHITTFKISALTLYLYFKVCVLILHLSTCRKVILNLKTLP